MNEILFDNLGIGIDLENINRFNKLDLIKDKLFLKKIFTKTELDYCYSKKNYGQHLAVRFVAKEAIIKAFNQLNIRPQLPNQIEIINNINNVPLVNLKGFKIKISLSHSKNMAIAFAIVKIKNEN